LGYEWRQRRSSIDRSLSSRLQQLICTDDKIRLWREV